MRKEEQFILMPIEELKDLLDHAVACVGLIDAVASYYITEGQLSTGALKHVATTMGNIASRLDALDQTVKEDGVPF